MKNESTEANGTTLVIYQFIRRYRERHNYKKAQQAIPPDDPSGTLRIANIKVRPTIINNDSRNMATNAVQRKESTRKRTTKPEFDGVNAG